MMALLGGGLALWALAILVILFAIPIVKGLDSQLGSSKDADFLQFVYGVASNAKVFAQSWDQALSPTAAEKLLDNIAKLFQLSITPQQFADNMNQVIGQ